MAKREHTHPSIALYASTCHDYGSCPVSIDPLLTKSSTALPFWTWWGVRLRGTSANQICRAATCGRAVHFTMKPRPAFTRWTQKARIIVLAAACMAMRLTLSWQLKMCHSPKPLNVWRAIWGWRYLSGIPMLMPEMISPNA